MKFFIFAFVAVLFVAAVFAEESTTEKPKTFNCAAAFEKIDCRIGKTKRVYYDAAANECKLLPKDTCADGMNQFSTLSACKRNCVTKA